MKTAVELLPTPDSVVYRILFCWTLTVGRLKASGLGKEGRAR
jgi:hypothetical protein